MFLFFQLGECQATDDKGQLCGVDDVLRQGQYPRRHLPQTARVHRTRGFPGGASDGGQ